HWIEVPLSVIILPIKHTIVHTQRGYCNVTRGQHTENARQWRPVGRMAGLPITDQRSIRLHLDSQWDRDALEAWDVDLKKTSIIVLLAPCLVYAAYWLRPRRHLRQCLLRCGAAYAPLRQ